MIGTLSISALVLSFMVAAPSMGTPVEAPNPTITVGKYDVLVNAAGNFLYCYTYSTDTAGLPIIPAPTPDASCNNAGLAFAVQEHTFYDTDPPKYTNANIDFFKTAKPIQGQTGSTKKLGFKSPGPNNQISIYGGPAIKIEYKAVNHHGYFIPPATGEYTITSKGADELALVWIGEFAYNGKYTRENARFEQRYTLEVKTMTYKINLQAGVWYPFRVLLVAAQGASALDIKVTAPDGTVLISSTSANTPYFVQYDCRRPSTKFQDFGKETA